jgi:galactose mutarotase-like enzyme
MWQADPKIWPRHAPILFPIVGKLANDRYSFERKTYELPQHGFARDMNFAIVEETASSLSYQLFPSSSTKQQYPFDFGLLVKYRLKGNSLEIQYEVRNNGEGVMPFSIGAHPGFALTWGEDDQIEDYFLEFEKLETLDTHFLGADHLLSEETGRILQNEKVLPIRKDMFNRDALILLDFESGKVSLRSHKHHGCLTVEFPGFPYLGIWAKPAAPFVCIEPWYGHVDPAKTDGMIMNKPGIIKLNASKTFTCAHRVVIQE